MAGDLKKQLEIRADATGVETGVAKAKRSLASLGDAAVKEGQKAKAGITDIGAGGDEAARKVDTATKGIQQSIQRTAALMEAGSRTSSKYFEILANQRGADLNALKPYLAQLDAVNQKQAAATQSIQGTAPALNQLGMSAKATAAAMRGVPAQFTDIVTSIQAGQAPITVFLQQGGQLKDMFGGIGPAARALGGYVLGLITPFTVAAASAAVLGVALVQGSSELRGFQNAATISGNAIAASASQFTNLRDSIAGIGATKGKAAEVLTEIAKNGRVASDNVELISRAAIGLERAMGQSLGKTVEMFASLADAPVAASVKLNESYNYLTASVYFQIKALEEQGKRTDAVNVAERALGEALESRAKTVVQNLGVVEKAWAGVTGAAKFAWDAMLGVGRTKSIAEQLAEVNAQIAKASGPFDASAFGGNAEARARLQINRDIQANLQEQVRMERRAADAVRDGNVARQQGLDATIAFSKLQDTFATKSQKMAKELEAAERAGVAAGKERVEIERVLAGIREKFKESGSAGVGQNEVAAIQAKTDAVKEYIARLRDQGLEAKKLTDGEGLVLKYQRELQTTVQGTARAEKERALEAAKGLVVQEKIRDAEEDRRKGLAASRDELLRQVDAVRKVAGSIQDQAIGQEAANEAYGKSKTAIEANTLALLKLQLAEADSRDSFDPAYVESLRQKTVAQERFVIALRKAEAKTLVTTGAESARLAAEETATLQLQFSLVGATASERAKILATREAELALAKRIAEIDRSGAGEADKEKARAEARATAAVQAENAVQKTVLADWERTNQQIADSFVDNLMRGGKSVAQYLKDLFRTLVLKPLLQPVGNAVSSFVNSVLPGNAAGLLGGGNPIGSALSNLFPQASDFVLSALGQGSGLAGVGATAAEVAGTISATSEGLLAAGASAAEAASAASALGGTMTAASSAFATLSAIAGPLAIGALLVSSFLKGRGETRSGGQYDGTQFIGGPSGGQIGGDGVAQAIGATMVSINKTLDALGSSSTLAKLVSGLEASEKGKGFAYAGGALNNGTVFGQGIDGQGFNNRRGNLTPEQATQAFQAELEQATLQAIQAAADIPETIARQLRGIDVDALADDARKALLANINASILSVQAFGESIKLLPFEDLKNLSFDATAAMLEAGGGLERFTGALNSYYENFYSEEEKRSNVARNIQSTLAGAGLNYSIEGILGGTREGFRALVESADGDAKQALLSVNAAFASIVPAAAGAGADVATLAASLDKLRSPLRTVEDIARSIFDLEQEGAGLQVDLLRAQGNDPAADVLQRSLDTAGFTAAEIALYDYNQTVRDQVADFNEAAAAAAELASVYKGLKTESANLQVQLLQAQGDAPGARALQRSIDIDGMDAASVALYDYNQNVRDQIDGLKDAAIAAAAVSAAADAAAASMAAALKGLQDQSAQLEVQLLQAQGDAPGARALQRAIDIAGLDAAGVALYDYNQTVRDQIDELNKAATAAAALSDAADAAAESMAAALKSLQDQAAQLEVQLLQAKGDPEGARALQRSIDTEGLDAAGIAQYDYNETLRDTIDLLAKAKTATEERMALEKRFYDNFAPAEYKRQATATSIASTLNNAGLGIAISPEEILAGTRLQVAEFMQSFIDMGEAGKPYVDLLVSVGDALNEVIPAFGTASTVIDKAVDALARLQVEGRSLEVQLLEAQGDAPGAKALQRTIDIEGLNAAGIAQYDYNQTIRDQIKVLNDAATAAAAMASALENLQSQSAQLEVELLQAKGDKTGARSLQRSIDIEGLDAAGIALYDYNQTIRDQITVLNDAATSAANMASALKSLQDQSAQLEVQLLEAKGDKPGARALQRTIDIAGLDAAGVAQYDYNQTIRDAIDLLTAAAQIATQRATLESQILQLEGNTQALRELELGAMDESLRPLQQRIYTLQDEAAAAQELIRIGQERTGLEGRLLQLQGNTAALRERELAALDPANRALLLTIYGLEDLAAEAQKTAQAQQAAAQKAAQIAQERQGLQQRIYQLEGNQVALRNIELEGIDASNRVLLRRVFALEDEAAAIQKAAQVTEERSGLERTLLDLQGNTAALRALDLAKLDESNRALQLQIWMLQDQAAAAQEAAAAAEQFRSTIKTLTDGLLDEEKRLREKLLTGSAGGLAQVQADFGITTAQARAGDQEALSRLPALSQLIERLAGETGTSQVEMRYIQAQLAASLRQTAEMVATAAGVVQPSGSTTTTTPGGITFTAPSFVNSPGMSGTGTARLEQLVEALTAKVVLLQDGLTIANRKLGEISEATNGNGTDSIPVRVINEVTVA